MRRVLIVDDELLVRVGIRMTMDWEAHGYTIVGEAADGAQALQKIEQLHPDLVLTDLKMNGMDGLAWIEKARQRWPQLRFLVLSNYNDFENVRTAMKLGASDYIFKLTAKEDELLRALGEIQWQDAAGDESEEVIRKNLPALKSNLFNKGVEQNYLSEEEYCREYQALGLRVPLAVPYLLVDISINNYFARRTRGDLEQMQMTRYSMCNIAEEVFNANTRAEAYRYGEDGIMLMISAPAAEQAPLWQHMAEDFSLVCEYFQRYLNLSVSGAVSEVHTGAGGLHAAAAEARERLSYRHLIPAGTLGRLSAAAVQKSDIPAEFAAASFENLLKCRDKAGAAQFLDGFFGWLVANGNCSLSQMRQYLYELYYALGRAAAGAQAVVNGPLADGLTLENTIRHCDTLQSIRSGFDEVLELLFAQGGAVRREVGAAQKYVLEHLPEEHTVAEAARRVNMSESYFAHIFKRETGTSFVDWVNRARVERARELLVNSDAKVGEIAEAVGVENRNYFNVLYKKLRGCTPREEREKKKQNPEQI